MIRTLTFFLNTGVNDFIAEMTYLCQMNVQLGALQSR
jgi:hypothetical protein